MREITGKDDYIGMDFVGVRAHESLARSKYDYENFGKKQRGQYSFNPILEWTSAEIWLYIFLNHLSINETYKKEILVQDACSVQWEEGQAIISEETPMLIRLTSM